jgi:hypothetical protein
MMVNALSVVDSTIDAPPSFKPAKKYSDISGLLVCTIVPTLIFAEHVRISGTVAVGCVSYIYFC